MANEYIELDTLKVALKIALDDNTRDLLLNQARASASRSIDQATGRRFWLDPGPVQRVYTPAGRVACNDDGDLLLVDDIGDTSGLVVEVGSGGTWTAVTDVETQPDNALADGVAVTGLRRRPGGWSGLASSTRVRVTTRFGWPAFPDPIVQAALIQSGRLFKRKDSPEGVTSSAEWGVVRLSRRDPDVWALIEPYVLPGFG
ncbi:hypothetical protein ACGFNU_24415 [Spirillospora sp. NPDC048911]|uniref:hypothetical protein n=1 Tax=Spirillospora sp. NPDC048911 TaxID=3364527 RepID=UPI003712A074